MYEYTSIYVYTTMYILLLYDEVPLLYGPFTTDGLYVLVNQPLSS